MIGKTLRHFDWVLLCSVMLLIGIGMITLWSLSPERLFLRQAIWVVFSFVLFFCFALLDYRVFRNHGGALLAMLIFGILVLSLLLVAGPITRGVTGWFRIG